MSEKRRKTIVLLEILAVLAMFLLPNLVNGIHAFFDPTDRYPYTYNEIAWLRIEHAISVMPIAIFVAWRSGKGLAKFGLKGFVWWEGAGLILATIFASFAASILIHRMFHVMAPELNAASVAQLKKVTRINPHTSSEYVMMVVSKFCGATMEEFIMRGYLITRLRSLVPQTWMATLIAAALFASYHIYEGVVSTFAIFTVGVVFTVPFLATKSIWPGSIAHSLYNMFIEAVLRA